MRSQLPLPALSNLHLLLRRCAAAADLRTGSALHALYLKSTVPSSAFLPNHLLLLYSRCDRPNIARKVFDEIPQPNVFSHNLLLAAFSRSSATLSTLRRIFSVIPDPDLISFNTLLSSYACAGTVSDALELFSRMRTTGIVIDGFTLSSVITALSGCGVDLLHALVVTGGFDRHPSVNNALISGYGKSGFLEASERVFEEMGYIGNRNEVSWNSMIVVYGQHREGFKAIGLFLEMGIAGFEVETLTMASVMTAFTAMEDEQGGAQFHARLFKTARERNTHVTSALVDFYSKCCRIGDARKVFDEAPDWDLVLWNSLISGYSINDEFAEEGLHCFREMQRVGHCPDDCSFVCVISSCSSPSNGKQVHALAIKSELRVNRVSVNNALVSMYSKCGSLKDASRLFERMPEHNTVSFNSMISGYAQHGLKSEALLLFEKMLELKNTPTSVTFVSVLSACVHTGRVDHGLRYFDAMKSTYGIEPGAEHYSCVIDLLARAGQFERAEELIETMPFDPDPVGWAALLSACRTHKNIDLAVKAAGRLVELSPSNASAYVMLANMYTKMGRWDEAATVRKVMRDRGVRKPPGCSWIEVKRKIHVFVADDSSHLRIREIYAFLNAMTVKMERAGYIRDNEADGQARLGHHSEKLAVAFGLISTSDGDPLLVMKNLRICGDCHDAMKLISAITHRDILVRDVHRFHCFSEGSCSCGDFW